MLVKKASAQAGTSMFKGLLLSNRFLINEKLSSGQFGQIFTAKDQKRNDRIVIVKISKDMKMNKGEFQILRNLNKLGQSENMNFPKVLKGGKFTTKFINQKND